ncbi:DUF4111 domain-containing protein [Paenibacillus sp. LMG 31458]|uniref:DUF4111 domain-containing protein n=1 Tax=Paenibacillus phytorum TaxID=2654977 RepID=A0ABX1Y389_9BACL|nr:DUF4111 domain-containing protein [Paenibacillus phytorum]
MDDAVLTLGKIAFTLEHRTIVTKDEGGYYLLEKLPSEWHRLVNEALRIRQSIDTLDYTSGYRNFISVA